MQFKAVIDVAGRIVPVSPLSDATRLALQKSSLTCFLIVDNNGDRSVAEVRVQQYYMMLNHIKGWLYQTQGENHDIDEIHALHLKHVAKLKPRKAEIGGEAVYILERRDVEDMKGNEFTEFLEGVIKYWSERGLTIDDAY